jgi:hypothetical protein
VKARLPERDDRDEEKPQRLEQSCRNRNREPEAVGKPPDDEGEQQIEHHEWLPSRGDQHGTAGQSRIRLSLGNGVVGRREHTRQK